MKSAGLTIVEIQSMHDTLMTMGGPKDNLGAYLGSGRTEGLPVRAFQVASLLEEVIGNRQKKWWKFWN